MPAFAPVALHTDRLTLRPLSAADAPALFAIFSNPEAMRYWSSEPWIALPQAEAYVAMQPAALKAAYADEPTAQAKAYALFTDGIMGAPARWVAAKESGGAPAWLYYFSFRRGVYEGLYPGAPHASEIPFVFHSWDRIDPRLSRGPETAEDRALTRIVHTCWVAFAKTGAPKCPTPEHWPAYDPVKDQLMQFDKTVAVREHFRKPQLDAQEAAKAALLSGQ